MNEYLASFGPNKLEFSDPPQTLEELKAEFESAEQTRAWEANAYRLSIMLQTSQAAQNQAQAEQRFADNYPPPCDRL